MCEEKLSQLENGKLVGIARRSFVLITHPVVNDANMAIWKPTKSIPGPRSSDRSEGLSLGEVQARAIFALNQRIQELIGPPGKKHSTNSRPFRRIIADCRPSVLPGKVLADAAGKRLFISDGTHRIVETDLDGNTLAVAGNGRGHTTALRQATLTSAGAGISGISYVADRRMIYQPSI